MDLDLRKIRYFMAVARELNFGRAARDLHIAQPVLSRQIRALEAELGVQLFMRDRRRTELTAAGEALYTEAAPLLAGAEALRRRVGRAGRGADSFTVAFMPGLTVTGAVRALTAAHPRMTVDVLRTSWADQVEVLRDGRADVSCVRLPIDQRGLKVRALFDEPRVAVLPTAHRLACKSELHLSDLAGETLLQPYDAVPEWQAMTGDTAPSGLSGPSGPPAALAVEEKLEHVAAERGVVVLPQSTAGFYHRPDVTAIAIIDIGPSRVALAWDATRRTRLISEFADLAATHLRAP
ncbi:LysR family transcriptional regulator [Streptomyces odonnellii]|uniref:LysR substrate-binding domain-containing protein n=1 Tax=Streptomyces odonnellii TaxID=1417980 RepID=UPI0006254284|nr:LysR substrate-binding domain-containing protein [Streptomyces odonnellii]